MQRKSLLVRWLPALAAAGFVVAWLLAVVACGAPQRPDGLDVRSLPTEVRANYELFADRCSRCHSLARPLNSDFSTMAQWEMYVERMRRQPGSGISPADEPGILAFLQYYMELRHPAREASP